MTIEKGIGNRNLDEYRKKIAHESEKSVEGMILFERTDLSRSDAEIFANRIESIIFDKKRYIDQGGAGAVYRLSDERLCIKVLHPHKSREERNTGIDFVAREAAFTLKMANIDVAGVRSPQCFGYWKSPEDGGSAILLEELDAVNLRHVLNGDVEFPASFDLETFLEGIYDYIEYLHEKMETVHGDLYARNVMIDRATGRARIIDFGEAKSLGTLSSEERERAIAEDLKRIEEIDDELEALTKMK